MAGLAYIIAWIVFFAAVGPLMFYVANAGVDGFGEHRNAIIACTGLVLGSLGILILLPL